MIGAAFLITAVLTAFIRFRQGDNTSDRIPARFSQQDLQYAEVLWGDSEAEDAETGNSFPGVQPQWAEEGKAETPYNYSSDPLEEDLHRQTQEEYHSRLYEEWSRWKERMAKKSEERAVSSHTGAENTEGTAKAGETGASPDDPPRESNPSSGESAPAR